MKSRLKTALFLLAALIVIGCVYWLYNQGFFNKLMFSGNENDWRSQQEEKITEIIKSGNIESCGQINYKSADGTDYKVICRNNIALSKVNETLDASWCDKLDDQLVSKDDCQRQAVFGKLAKNGDLSVCDGAPAALQTECRDGFWVKSASEKNDIGLCANVGNEEGRDSCRENFYIGSLILSPAVFKCSVFSDLLKDDCENFQKVKIEKIPASDVSVVCDQLFDPRLKNACQLNYDQDL